MRNKPIEEKLGYVPSIKILKPFSADQKELTAESLVFKVIVYFGGLMEKASEGTILEQQPDLQGMSRLLHNAVRLDPYNMDAYYFAQGFLTWDARQFKVANDLLDYGMKHRTWDWQLPYFAGFNSSYFLHDYKKAADYYKLAGDLSSNILFKRLASRYMQESGQTDLAIAYLSTMAKGERNQALKKTFLTRLSAFREVKRIEVACDRFRESHGTMPVTIEQLISAGFLSPTPVDPYGGRFYLDPKGKVATTSKFAFGAAKKDGK
jgi:tetratricopeptide (TPR) repeat protein